MVTQTFLWLLFSSLDFYILNGGYVDFSVVVFFLFRFSYTQRWLRRHFSRT